VAQLFRRKFQRQNECPINLSTCALNTLYLFFSNLCFEMSPPL
jgi:hypothetical protein